MSNKKTDCETIATAKQRAAFRRKPAWQAFRRLICASRGMTCEFCGKQYRRLADLNVHHRYTTHYDNLDESRFLVLCRACHDFVHIKYKSPAFAGFLWFGLVD